MINQITKDNNMSHHRKHRYSGVRPAKQPNTWIIDYIDHVGKRHQKSYHGTESEAVKVRRGFLAKVDKIKAGLESAPEKAKKRLTFWELWELFKENRQIKVLAGSMDQQSLDKYGFSITAFCNYQNGIKHKRIDRITSRDIEAFKIHRLDKEYSPMGINSNLRNLRTLFKFAVDNGFLNKSPFLDVAPLTTRELDVRFLNEDELQAVHTVIDSLDLSDDYQKDARDLFLFYLYTGARTSEALLPHFDWSCDGQNSVRFPETKRSRSRIIPKTDTIKQVLESRKHMPNGPFSFNRDQVYRRVKYILELSGIKDASTHTLRKTAGAWYYMATHDIFAASRFLGHSSVLVTERHYSGLIQSLQIEYSNAFEHILNSKLHISCNFQTEPDQTRLIAQQTKIPELSSGIPVCRGPGSNRHEVALTGV